MGCKPSVGRNRVSVSSPKKKTCNAFLKEGIKFEHLDFHTASSIGSGGFGDVLHIKLKLEINESLAVKVINVNGEDDTALKEMNNEIDQIDRITQERVRPRCFPKYYGYFTETNKANNIVFNVCFKYLPQTLASLIKDHASKKTEIPANLLINFFNTLVNGLCFLQILGICHRDLKPQNLMLDETQKNLTIIDFVAAKNIIQQAFHPLQTKMNVTIIGTRHYASPEMLDALNKTSDETTQDSNGLGDKFTTLINPFKSDVFSFGLVFMELWRLKRINNKSGQEQIDDIFEKLQNDIRNSKHPEMVKKKLESMRNILSTCLKINPKERLEFKEMFKQNIDLQDKKKMRYHMKVDECVDTKELEDFFRRCK